MQRRQRILPLAITSAAALIGAAAVFGPAYYFFIADDAAPGRPLIAANTLAGGEGEIGEPFGVAARGRDIFVSDGTGGKIWHIAADAKPVEYAHGLNTPSAIAFDKDGSLIVADTGSHTVRKIAQDGVVSIIAGADGQPGDADGPALSARFNAPVGVSVLPDGAIAVADTYNDKIKLIRNGSVTTLAGSTRGRADGAGGDAKFDTPCGITPWADGSLLVADTGNALIRLVSSAGVVTTLAGGGNSEFGDGSLLSSRFSRPYAIASGPDGSLFIADGNSIRVIRNRTFPVVETMASDRRGYTDGPIGAARFNRLSGLAVSDGYRVVIADTGNAALRIIDAGAANAKAAPEPVDRRRRTAPDEFRTRAAGRWPYDPPEARRDIAGTLGEIRGLVVDQTSRVWFHNGLDIAGAYGERARFIRDEIVSDPLSTENFGTLRELIRLPTVGYIHIRLGRDADGRTLGDARFQFDPGMTGVRVRRGTAFKAGETVGTLNPMNHVHLIAGAVGDEMNALDALDLPGVTDTTPPIIEETAIYNENWQPVETRSGQERITITGRTRVVVRAFDRMDGNPERRRLGVFRLGFQILARDNSPVTGLAWNISFDRNPPPEAVLFAYAPGSHSGATGETIFRYIVTNHVNNDGFGEGFLDPAELPAGEYLLRVFAADHFGNTASKDTEFEVAK